MTLETASHSNGTLSTNEVFNILFPALRNTWKKADLDLYQYDNPRARTVIDNLGFLCGCNVLDIGCNSGLYSLLLAPTCPSVEGIDVNARYIAMAKSAQDYFQENVYDVTHVTFKQAGLYNVNPAQTRIDAVLACNVLYHLLDSEIAVLARLLTRCHKVFFQVRPRREMAYAKNKESFHYISRNSVCGGLFTIGHVIAFLEPLGFQNFTIRGEEAYWLEEPFPVVMASRSLEEQQ